MKLPARAEVYDYHEFDQLKRNLKSIDKTWSVFEVRCGPSQFNDGGCDVYHGIIYRGKKDTEAVKKLREQIDREIHDDICGECSIITIEFVCDQRSCMCFLRNCW